MGSAHSYTAKTVHRIHSYSYCVQPYGLVDERINRYVTRKMILLHYNERVFNCNTRLPSLTDYDSIITIQKQNE